jgi:hypothetical protein
MADVAVQPAAEPAPSIIPDRWSLARRLAFRFCCCYWLLYCLPEPGRVNILQAFPGGSLLAKPYTGLWHTLCPWAAIHIFHLSGQPVTYFRTGSGDTTLGYVQNLLFVVFALFGAAIWSLLDGKRPNYRALDGWLRLLVRYTLAFTLFSYGFAKVFPLQFQPAGMRRLMEPFGEFSPMGVLWSFMGASQPYTIYIGASEVLGGLLLLFRRTVTLGAMVSGLVMMNVAVLNFCYDVPVKLYSTNLVLMAVFLLGPDLTRLFGVLVLNRAVEPATHNSVTFARRPFRIAALAFWVLFIGYHLFGQIRGGWQAYQQTYYKAQRPPTYGLYDIESGGPAGWRRVVFEFLQVVAVRSGDDRVVTLPVEYAGNTIRVNHREQFTWSRPDSDHLVLEGSWNGAPASIRLRKVDTSKFLLFSRGFHWISETAFNR